MKEYLVRLFGVHALEVLARPLLGNPLWQYGMSAGLFAAVWGATWIFKNVVAARLHALARKTSGDFDDFLIGEIARLRFWFCFSLSLFFATRPLALPGRFHQGLHYCLMRGWSKTLAFRRREGR